MFYHISLVPVDKFEPRIPTVTYETEDRTIKRICVSSNIQKALQAAPQMGNILKAFLDNGIKPVLYVYTFHKKDFKKGEYKTPNEIVEYVGDAIQNQEYWLLKEPTKYTCRKFYVTDAWIKELTDMFGMKEHFCIHTHLKQTKSKKTNENLILEFFKNTENSKLVETVLSCDVSFRGKMRFLIEEGYFGKNQYYGHKNEKRA